MKATRLAGPAVLLVLAGAGCRNIEKEAIEVSHSALLREARKDLRARRYDAAVRKLERAAALKPDHALTRFRLGNALVARARQPDVTGEVFRRLVSRALEEHRAALRLAPKVPQAHYHVGRDLILLGRPAEAIPYLEKARELDPRSPYIDACLGDARRAMGEYDLALAHYRAGLARKPKPPAAMELHEGLAETLAALGKKAEALAEFEQALRNAPTPEHVKRLQKRIEALRGAVTSRPAASE